MQLLGKREEKREKERLGWLTRVIGPLWSAAYRKQGVSHRQVREKDKNWREGNKLREKDE